MLRFSRRDIWQSVDRPVTAASFWAANRYSGVCWNACFGGHLLILCLFICQRLELAPFDVENQIERLPTSIPMFYLAMAELTSRSTLYIHLHFLRAIAILTYDSARSGKFQWKQVQWHVAFYRSISPLHGEPNLKTLVCLAALTHWTLALNGMLTRALNILIDVDLP